MSIVPLIKTGPLAFLKVWPKASLYLANGRPLSNKSFNYEFEAYGYKEISHFFYDTDSMEVSLQSDKGEFPIGGLIIEHGHQNIKKKTANYLLLRFYKILPEGNNKPLWFPETDVTTMTKETYEVLKKILDAKEEEKEIVISRS